jgi:hypothetical protein
VANVIAVDWTPAAVPSDLNLEIWATGPKSKGRSIVGDSEYRFMTLVPEGETPPWSINYWWGVLFGAWIPDQKIFVKLRFVNVVNGEVGPWAYASAIVT